jgi:hypothetical protein
VDSYIAIALRSAIMIDMSIGTIIGLNEQQHAVGNPADDDHHRRQQQRQQHQ